MNKNILARCVVNPYWAANRILELMDSLDGCNRNNRAFSVQFQKDQKRIHALETELETAKSAYSDLLVNSVNELVKGKGL